MTCWRPLSFFFFAPPLFSSPPAFCRGHLVPLHCVVFSRIKQQFVIFQVLLGRVEQQPFSFRFFVLSMQQVSVPLLQHVHALLVAVLPFLSGLFVSHSSEQLSYVLLVFFSFLSFFAFFFSWSGLLCCVLQPCTLALHLLYIDELRLVGLLCCKVCDHRI